MRKTRANVRGRVQFGLGTLLLATSAVAVSVAWFARQVHVVRERDALRTMIHGRGGSAYAAEDLAVPSRTSALRRWLGDEPVLRIYLPPPDFSHQDFACVRAAFPEAYIWPMRPVAAPERPVDKR